MLDSAELASHLSKKREVLTSPSTKQADIKEQWLKEKKALIAKEVEKLRGGGKCGRF